MFYVWICPDSSKSVARQSARIPVVLTVAEVQMVLGLMRGAEGDGTLDALLSV
jgi:hypothetical protein